MYQSVLPRAPGLLPDLERFPFEFLVPKVHIRKFKGHVRWTVDKKAEVSRHARAKLDPVTPSPVLPSRPLEPLSKYVPIIISLIIFGEYAAGDQTTLTWRTGPRDCRSAIYRVSPYVYPQGKVPLTNLTPGSITLESGPSDYFPSCRLGAVGVSVYGVIHYESGPSRLSNISSILHFTCHGVFIALLAVRPVIAKMVSFQAKALFCRGILVWKCLRLFRSMIWTRLACRYRRS